jgi:hypothetical protein
MSTFKYEPYVCPVLSSYTWRNAELSRTDILVATPDHPQREELLTYRTALRDWPATDDFPDTRPEVG